MMLFVLPPEKYQMARDMVAATETMEHGVAADKFRIQAALIKEANAVSLEDLRPGFEYNTIDIVEEPGKGFFRRSRLVIHVNHYRPDYNPHVLCATTAWGGIHETRLRDGMLLLQF